MHTRKLVTALATAAIAVACFGAAVFPASAEQRTFQITLATGQTLVVTVDVPPGTPVDQISFPGVTGPIASVTEITPAPGPSGGGATEQAPTPTTPTNPAGPAAPQQQQDGGQDPAPAREEPQAGSGGRQQETTGPSKRRGNADKVAGALGDAIPGDIRRSRDSERRSNGGGGQRDTGGAPTLDNPTLSVATPGAAPIGVPNFFIDKFRIPPFLLSIYQAAGIEYGVRWEVLAAINEIETDYGRNLNVSSAGALGWMQFMPATWRAYGVDANRDGRKDPYNPVDAIFAAARYLRAAGAEDDLRKAVFAYNHADWYVDSVLMRARLIGGLPANLVGSLTGLTQGLFPVYGTARYADDISEREATKRMRRGQNAAIAVDANKSRRGINIYAKPGTPAVAVQDGKIVKMGQTERLGRFIMLRDVYGNTYTYAHLKKFATRHPVPKRETVTKQEIAKELKLPRKDPRPTSAASAGEQRKKAPSPSARPKSGTTKEPPQQTPEVKKERLFARPHAPGAFRNGGEDQLLDAGVLSGFTTFKSYIVKDIGLSPDEVVLRRLKVGSRVIAGTILGRIGRTSRETSPHMLFEIRPAGRGAPRIDPKPILDGWKLLESTAIYRAKGKNPFFGRDARQPTVGQILLMSKSELERRVLANPRVDIYECGQRDIRGSRIDRRVLATLEFLAANGLRPTVTSLTCGHGFFTASGNVSHHSSGNAVDIAKLNGVPILGHQGKGSITDIAVRRLLTLQGTMKPAQIITLMEYEGADNTAAMGDHHDHIHVGFQPLYGTNSRAGRELNAILKPGQWIKLIDRLGEIDNPTVRTSPSKAAITVTPRERASGAHHGE